jgi:formyl-CoA transferase
LQDDLGRGDNFPLINEVMSAWCAARTTAEAVAQLEAAQIPCGPVNELADVLADPQVQARELLHQLSWADESKPVPVVNPAVRLSETPGEVRAPAPELGEHTDAILAELGYTAEQIATFRQQAVV